MLIKIRLSNNLENKVWRTQYGFRKARSTAQALFIARRVLDLAEAGTGKMIFTFLDWEKAFDKVDQTKLQEALFRLNIPDKVLRIIGKFHENPQFRIKTADSKSNYRKQCTGIRQGCPLSPYLFILFMTVMFTDIYERVGHLVNKGVCQGTNFFRSVVCG